ncbi:hypothetical protein niasHT_027320 [Heterodera trifolii]|uniref:SUI1 domain-containing protein n=1 Tax=Heterodera trifolii TaxID=157864 RepID=A0ABD2JTM6_9BILA
MFRKQFTTKSSVNLRHSERKAFFPSSINTCFNAKQQFVRISVSLPNSNLCLYALNKEPLFFQCLSSDCSPIFPTVYFLWSDAFRDQFPVLFVSSAVLPILQNGSDLMIPANAPIAIGIVGGKGDELRFGPVAVGQSLFSAAEIRAKRQANERGKAIKILHVHGDSLWEFGSRKPIPKMVTKIDTTETSGQSISNRQTHNQHEDVQQQQSCSSSPTNLTSQNEDETVLREANGDTKTAEGDEGQAEMDELLRNTFFTALRWKFGPNGPLPIDAGQFYANYMLKSLPPDRKLEIKKTRFKKFSNFLRELGSDGGGADGWLIRLKSVKGVDTIEEVNHSHPLVQSAPEPEHRTDAAQAGSSADAHVPFLTIRENMFSLTERVMPIFRPYGFSKGDIVDLNKIRAVLLDYAQQKNLCRGDGKQIELDDPLQTVVQHFVYEKFDVNKLVQKVASTMTQALLIRTKEGKQIVHRGTKMPHVDLKIERRAGNKVVTLVSNLASFGIDASALDNEIRGTGTSILATAPACEGPQLLVQGNEINRIGRLLAEFGLPKKFVTGLEQGIKESKKKKK